MTNEQKAEQKYPYMIKSPAGAISDIKYNEHQDTARRAYIEGLKDSGLNGEQIWNKACEELLANIAWTFRNPDNLARADNSYDKVVFEALGDTIQNFPIPKFPGESTPSVDEIEVLRYIESVIPTNQDADIRELWAAFKTISDVIYNTLSKNKRVDEGQQKSKEIKSLRAYCDYVNRMIEKKETPMPYEAWK